jgi:glycerol-3-phosphate dehydrogenase
MKTGSPVVLILGAGINGCALARELALNGVSVWLVDTADIASGATSGSSRLVHGGLRYLEFGEFDLVKESLAERTRLLRLAPQFVRPLRLWIPAATRLGGFWSAPGRFFGWQFWPSPTPKAGRGAALVRAGLAFYDAYARDPHWPKHHCTRAMVAGAPSFDRQKFRWLCSYYDAQVTFPERLVVALLDDARNMSEQQGLDFRVFTYHKASLAGDSVEILPVLPDRDTGAGCTLKPSVIVNATGAWVDETLQRLHVPSARLIGGTKGSHLFTFSPRLREALSGQGVYAEARDGRPIFVTPLAETILIGTTDVPFDGPPESAVATRPEQEYLLDAVNTILPDARLESSDIAFHYSAVRPLPHVSATTPAAITRRHSIVKNDLARVPLFSIVGGKLTTMRSLAESTAAIVLAEMGRPMTANSRERLIPGAEGYPADTGSLSAHQEQIANRVGFSPGTVAAVWRLVGTRAETELASADDRALVADTELPCSFVRASIRREWARTLADLVERRLMLLYDQRLTTACLRRLAELLAECGHLPAAQVEAAVANQVELLQSRYGRRVE